MADFSRALELEPGQAEVHFRRGFSLWRAGDASRARGDLELAARHSPHAQIRDQARQTLAQMEALGGAGC